MIIVILLFVRSEIYQIGTGQLIHVASFAGGDHIK